MVAGIPPRRGVGADAVEWSFAQRGRCVMRQKGVFVSVCVVLVLLACCVVEAKDESGTKTVFVDCEKGDSISEALKNKSDDLIIEIAGMCEENVSVQRNNLTLRGTDPETDGVRGVIGVDEPVLLLQYSSFVNIENLTIERAGEDGINARWSLLLVTNCRIRENGRYGVAFSDAAAWFWDTTITANESTGARIAGGSSFVCEGCDISSNGWYQATAFDGVHAHFRNCQIAGGHGVAGQQYSLLSLTDTTVAADGWALVADYNGQLLMTGREVTGALWAGTDSSLELSDVEQVSSAFGNFVEGNSFLSVDDSTTVRGATMVSEFSKIALQGESLLDGDLICASAGDAYADDPATQVTGLISGCVHAMKAGSWLLLRDDQAPDTSPEARPLAPDLIVGPGP